MELSKKQKLWIVLGVAALVVILLTVLALRQNIQTQEANRIELPADTSSVPAEDSAGSGSQFSEITADNVQTVIRNLARAESYHQTLSITTEYDSAIRKQTVNVWKYGDVCHVTTEEAASVRHCLTDGKTLYLWYAGDRNPSSVTLDGSVSLDDLLGISTYEEILELPQSQIRQANFVVLSELENQPCVFISTEAADTEEYYWVSFRTGLLCKQTSLLDNTPLRTVEQTAYEPLSDADLSAGTLFTLPDGSEPFAIRK